MPYVCTPTFSIIAPPPPLQLRNNRLFPPKSPHPISTKFPPCPHFSVSRSRKEENLFCTKSPFSSSSDEQEGDVSEDEWLQKLPEKKKALYAHSLPCVDAWLKSLGFYQSRDDRALWFVEKPDWHAQLSLDVTNLYIRYLKNGPGNLEEDIERRFSMRSAEKILKMGYSEDRD